MPCGLSSGAGFGLRIVGALGGVEKGFFRRARYR